MACGNKAGRELWELTTGPPSVLSFNLQQEAPTRNRLIQFLWVTFLELRAEWKEQLRVGTEKQMENKQQNVFIGFNLYNPSFYLASWESVDFLGLVFKNPLRHLIFTKSALVESLSICFLGKTRVTLGNNGNSPVMYWTVCLQTQVEALIPNVTIFGDRTFKEVTEVKWGHEVGPNPIELVSV